MSDKTKADLKAEIKELREAVEAAERRAGDAEGALLTASRIETELREQVVVEQRAKLKNQALGREAGHALDTVYEVMVSYRDQLIDLGISPDTPSSSAVVTE